MLISKTAVAEFLDRKLDDHNWIKKAAPEDFDHLWSTWKRPPKFVTPPWAHQRATFTLGAIYPEFMFALDMGAGKTKITYDILEHRDRRGDLERALVLTPRDLVTSGWETAAGLHSHLEPNAILCESNAEKWERLVNPGSAALSIITYQGLVLATCKKGVVKKGLKKVSGLVRDDKKIRELRKLYNCVVMDESHKLKNKDSLWYSVVRSLTSVADMTYGLTGTLFGHDPEEVWSQILLVDKGDTFGPNVGIFRSAFFDTTTDFWGAEQRTFRRSMQRTFTRMLRHRCIRYDETELTDLPSREEVEEWVPMGEEAREHYLRALQGLVDAEGKLGALDAQWLRMRQICSGYLDWQDEHGHHHIDFANIPKLERTIAITEQALGSTKVVLCYDYTCSGSLLFARCKAEGWGPAWIYGGTKDKPEELKRFLADPACRVLIMNSEAAGTGTDGLQSVARCLIYYESPPSPITRQQTIKRIHRPGQTGRCRIIDMMTRRSVEGKIVAAAKAGKNLHDALIGGASLAEILA